VGPSANQLMRALHRKGKANGVSAEDVKVVAAIHTVVTESTWAQIMEYEELHESYACCPSFVHFFCNDQLTTVFVIPSVALHDL
jgi:hypothetical protein